MAIRTAKEKGISKYTGVNVNTNRILKKQFIILFICCFCFFKGYNQIIPSIRQLSSGAFSKYKKQLNSRKDSAVSVANKVIKVDSIPVTSKNKIVTEDSAVQQKKDMITKEQKYDDSLPQYVLVPSDRIFCKEVIMIRKSIKYDYIKVPFMKVPFHTTLQLPTQTKHIPFLQAHGNIMYNVNYYSRIDTPYSERNIYQHTIQTYLDLLINGQYPIKIYLTNRFSNSSLFKNFSDFNFSYYNNSFSQSIKNQVAREFLKSTPSQKGLDSLQNLLDKDLLKFHLLDTWIKNPALIQKMVEARELAIHKPQSKTDSTSSKSEIADIDTLYLTKKREADSLFRDITLLKQLLQNSRLKSQAAISQTLQNIRQADNPAQLRQEMASHGLSDSSLPKGYKTLMAIKSFNLGRTVVNYSELSAKNISINGVQTEYKPSGAYYALATGSVDYRFRDFILNGPAQPRQYLNVLRYGRMLKDGNSIVLTYFQGHRQLYNSATTDSLNTVVPSSALMGITLEGNYRLTNNISLTAEVGKSSAPAYADSSTKRNSYVSQLFQTNNRSNEAWSLKMNAFFPGSHTRIRGSYKHLGVNYQSFSIFTDGTSQTAWSGSIDQLLFKNQLDVMLSANTNDFSNPFINEEYKSTTIFKSAQVTWRRRNWPVVSLGYYPSSQITKLGTGQYLENMFYTLVGNMSYSYSVHHTLMNTALVYTQFYNHSADSGFIYFNTRNLLLAQSIFLNKFTIQGNASAATNQSYQLYTLEGKLQYSFSKMLTLGAGIKYDKQTVYNIDQIGYSGQMTLNIPRFGQVQFSADKGFIPGVNNRLVPDNRGRLTYFKIF